MPERIQHRRSKGWRMPPNTVSVKRPGFWGNWMVVGNPGRLWIKVDHPNKFQIILEATLSEPVDQIRAVAAHRRWLETEAATYASLGLAWMIPGFDKMSQDLQTIIERELLLKRRLTLKHLPELAGKNLACTCAIGTPCHSQVLLERANPQPHSIEEWNM